MGLIVKRGQNEFEMTPAGVFDAVCIQLIELGTQSTQYVNDKGDPIFQKKVRIVWELVDELMKDNRPFIISKEYTASLSEKSILTKELESWRGKNFTDKELEGFDLNTILGKACQLNIIYKTNEKTNKTYPIISSIIPKNKHFKFDKTFNEIISLDLDDFNIEIFEKLPDFVKEKIKKSPEYQKIQNIEIEKDNDIASNVDIDVNNDISSDIEIPFNRI